VTGSLSLGEHESEVRRSNLFGGVEPEFGQQRPRTLTDRLDLRLRRLSLHLDERLQSGHVVEGDGVPVEFEPFAALLDCRRRLVAEPVENALEGCGVFDCGLVFRSGLRGRLD
jgi:hypothetical protein